MADTAYLHEAKRRFLAGTGYKNPIDAVHAGKRSIEDWCNVLADVRAERQPSKRPLPDPDSYWVTLQRR